MSMPTSREAHPVCCTSMAPLVPVAMGIPPAWPASTSPKPQPKPESTEPSGGGAGKGPSRDGEGIDPADFRRAGPVVGLLPVRVPLMRWPEAARNSRWPIRAARVGETFDWLADEGEGCGSAAGAAVRKGVARRAFEPGRY